ncbi:MAG: hypothetical protein AAGF92_00295 [Myxococcota bacterium]
MASTETDGRRQRAEKHRDAVVRAVLAAVKETGRVPPVAELGDLAGVSRRTVFRLFDDMESLHVAATRVQRAEVIRRFPPPFPTGQPLEERIRLLVDHRASVYELIRPLRRVAEKFREESPTVRKDLAQSHAELRMHAALMLSDALPDPGAEREHAVTMLGLVTGFGAWRTLREDDALSVADAKDAMTFAIVQLAER